MSNTLKFGNGEWYGKEGTILAYNSENNNYKPLPFTFDRASSATRVNKDGLIETVGADQPRVDYLNDSKGALKLEPSRTNSITYSNDFSQSIYGKIDLTITANQGISPDGTQNANLLVPNAAVGSRYLTNNTGSNLKINTVFLKKKELRYVNFGNAQSKVLVDLENGTISADTVSTNNFTIENYGNGWYRVSCYNTLDVNLQIQVVFGVDGSGSNIATNGTDGVYIYGFEIQNGSYATSIINTSGSAVTRSAESCYQQNDYVLSNTSGTIFFEIGNYNTNTSPNGFNKILVFQQASSSSLDNAIYFEEYNGDNTILIRKGGSTVLQSTPNYQDLRGSKVGIKFSNTEAKIFIDGVLNNSYSGNASLSLEYFGFDNPYNGSIVSSIKLKNLQLYNTALTDQELIALTT